MPSTSKRIRRAAFAALIGLMPPLAQSAVLWSENFDAATPGQSIGAPPLNWTLGYLNDLFVGPATVPGWQGNAIVGQYHERSGDMASIRLPTLPNSGIVRFSFDAWAPIYSAGGFTLHSPTGYVSIGASSSLANPPPDYQLESVDLWQMAGTWTGGGVFSQSDRGFMYTRTVHVLLSIDYDKDVLDVIFNDGSSTFALPTAAFTDASAFTALTVNEGGNNPYTLPVIFDNLQIEAVTVPEPAAWTLLLASLAMLGWRARRNR